MTKFGELIMSLIVINKLGEDARGRHHEFMIANEVKVQIKSNQYIYHI